MSVIVWRAWFTLLSVSQTCFFLGLMSAVGVLLPINSSVHYFDGWNSRAAK